MSSTVDAKDQSHLADGHVTIVEVAPVSPTAFVRGMATEPNVTTWTAR